MAEQPTSRVWRVPAWQISVLIVLIAIAAAVAMYAHPPTYVVFLCVVVALALLYPAVCAWRYRLVADDNGIWVRRLAGYDVIEWAQLTGIRVISPRQGTITIRFIEQGGAHLDVPPSLVLPGRPGSVAAAMGRVSRTADELRDLATAQGSPLGG